LRLRSLNLAPKVGRPRSAIQLARRSLSPDRTIVITLDILNKICCSSSSSRILKSSIRRSQSNLKLPLFFVSCEENTIIVSCRFDRSTYCGGSHRMQGLPWLLILYWLIDWLIDWLIAIDWLTYGLIDWLTKFFINYSLSCNGLWTVIWVLSDLDVLQSSWFHGLYSWMAIHKCIIMLLSKFCGWIRRQRKALRAVTSRQISILSLGNFNETIRITITVLR